MSVSTTPPPHEVIGAGPGVAHWWQRWRRIVAVVAAMIIVAVIVGIIQSRQSRGYLDPDGVDPGGSRAIVRLLEDQGVEVTPVRSTDDAVAAAGDGTLLVTVPDLLAPAQVDQLLDTGADLVLVTPDVVAGDFLPGLTTTGTGQDEVVDPRCDLSFVDAAGDARVGGLAYLHDDDATGCYPIAGGSAVVVADDDTRRTIVLGSGSALTNEHLGDDGNAALAINLLAQNDHLTWYRPVPEAGDGPPPTLTELLPDWVGPVVWQLGLAAALAALWRARRLGPLVPEALPVVVRASETTEGRARLYRRGRSRAHAATILREATTHRLRTRLGLPASAEASDGAAVGADAGAGTAGGASALVDAVAARAGRDASAVAELLAGSPPTDDAGLVRLADALDELEEEVRAP